MTVADLKEQFESVAKQLKKNAWFKSEKWIASAHPFPSGKPDGVTFHLFKKNWFNEDGRGIHVESYLDLSAPKRKKTYVTLHTLHHAKIPGTDLKRIEFSKPFTDRALPLVKKWAGYKLRAGKYGQQPFTYFLDGNSPAFRDELAAEVSRICRELGPEVDRVLAQLKSR